jgi:lycopene cyclase domain-containing protein
MKSEYFLVLALSVVAPFILSFSKNLDFYKYPARLILSIGIPFVIFVVWDMIVTARGHWSFNPKYITGIMLYDLPIEEVLFFIIIPFCGIFTWESVKYFMREKK